MTRSKPLISVVIPCYNEEKNIVRAYKAVRDVFETLPHYDFEIVFTDNHSTDNSFQEMDRLAQEDKRVRVARFSRNFGFNKSLLTGYRLARGKAAIQLDCDLQDPPALFPVFLQKWEEGHDVVAGVRMKRKESPALEATRKIFYRLLNSMSEDNLMEDAGDFRLVDKSVLDQLRELNAATPYVRGLIAVFGRNPVGVPYEREARIYDESKFPVIKLIDLAVEGIVSHSTVPLRISSLAGFGIAGCTFLLALFYIFSRALFGWEWPPGFATQTVLILFGISLNAIFLGIIGEYISRIYQQLQGRPLTVIEKAINLTGETAEQERKAS